MTALKTALLFEDSRAHFVFTDSTAIILHSKGDCFTYFDKTSAKTRQLVKFAVNSAARASS